MLDRIAQSEETATGVFESVAQRDQFFPAVDADAPAVSQIAFEFFRIDAEIGHVGIEPDERMELFDVSDGRSILLAPINLYRSGIAQLNGNDARRGIGAEEQRVGFEGHP